MGSMGKMEVCSAQQKKGKENKKEGMGREEKGRGKEILGIGDRIFLGLVGDLGGGIWRRGRIMTV